MKNKIELTKSVPREQWGEFFDQFSDGNRGRHMSIEIINSEIGDGELIQDAPLIAMVYDRPEVIKLRYGSILKVSQRIGLARVAGAERE